MTGVVLDPLTTIVGVHWGSPVRYLSVPVSVTRDYTLTPDIVTECATWPYHIVDPDDPNDQAVIFVGDFGVSPRWVQTIIYTFGPDYNAGAIVSFQGSRNGTTWTVSDAGRFQGTKPANPGSHTLPAWDMVGWATSEPSLARLHWTPAEGGTAIVVPGGGSATFKSGTSAGFKSIGVPFNGDPACYATGPFLGDESFEAAPYSAYDLTAGTGTKDYALDTAEFAGLTIQANGKDYAVIGHYVPAGGGSLTLLFELIET